jgi:sugar (pentulose or hexulose) kinase
MTGRLASDVCSLGCHTDLWNPQSGTWSSLPERLGLAGRMAPPRRPDEVLGTLTPALQAELGLGPIPVLVGIHDSNASLLPHLRTRAAPFSVVSTGTWVIAMAIGGKSVTLDPTRDTLVNVNALGQPVPSARLMGGREHDLLGPVADADAADAAAVLAQGAMLLPAVVQGSGPFPQRRMAWTQEPHGPGGRAVAVGWYLALMTTESLSIIGADGPTLVEGPLARNHWFTAMLASATGRPVIPAPGRTGTAPGAALLAGNGTPPAHGTPILPQPDLAPYAARWRTLSHA